jgi:hypothetical protein
VNQEYTGRLLYTPDFDAGAFRLLVAVPCRVEGFVDRVYALVDTAGEWCVLPPHVCAELGIELIEGDGDTFLSTRFGLMQGRLERIAVTLDAVEGDPLTIDATCFVSADWPGPMVIGWRGYLERINFGFNNTEEAFYFAPGG